jgi:hypothetical protein
MTATPALTTDLQRQVRALEDDLRRRVDEDPAVREEWQRTHRQATSKERTAWSWAQWRDDRVTQTAVAWVLMSVFIRFCEDNALVKPVWITGPGRRRQEALDAEMAFFREHGTWTEREWLEDAMAYLGRLPATKALVDTHSALRYASPSGDAVEALIKFWRDRDDHGKLIHDLQDETLSTRFLGDLYQNLSKHAQDTYALLQTPPFVEEQILNWTLEPALQERPLEGFRMIDPTCGSGHFLLGAFDRILDRWHRHAPAMEIQSRVQSALDAIHGVDLNPFAVAIARFRLTVAALKACDLRSLEGAPAFKYHLAVGDSLIHGPDSNVLPGMEERGAFVPFHYATEDAQLLLEILEERRYDTVVGNPPYITVKDSALNKMYRSKFGKICKGSYALTVPFTVQFFALAKRGEESGWVGMITSNSFMKREFGVPLIETYLPTIDLRLVIDSEGAWIPGHNMEGTPTVIIVGKSQPPVQPFVRAILSKGSRETREHGSEGEGPYWSAIVEHWNDPAWDDDWISVTDLDRPLLSSHPWSLSGGGALQLATHLESIKSVRLGDLVSEIGFGAVTREDSAYMLGEPTLRRYGIAEEYRAPIVEGDNVRDWVISNPVTSLWPYDRTSLMACRVDSVEALLWPYRSLLTSRVAYGNTQIERGLSWFEYSMFFAKRFKVPFSIAFAFISSHNHFTLDRGGRVFNRSAPIVKLPQGATEEDHLKLLGPLNSSTACFWLRQKSQPKGGAADLLWSRTFEFTGTTLMDFPLPKIMPMERTRILDDLSRQLAASEPSAVCEREIPSRDALAAARQYSEEIRARMIAVQEELDWEVYRLYGLLDEDLTYGSDDLPGLAFGERAFEIALARSREETAWFERHGSKPVTEVCAKWPAAYQELVQRRLRCIAAHPHIRLLEKPEHKRRWLQDPWDKRQERALREWLLDRLEGRQFWFDGGGGAEPKSVAQLADEVTRDADMVSVLALWEGRPDVPVSESLEKLLGDEAVPFLAAYRYKDSGLRKREAWEETWDLQRREDRGEKVGTIRVPPKYTAADFCKLSYWRARGKVDVPKERFILYPDAGRQGDPTTLLGWAGWDHAEQSLALSRIIGEREQEGWDDERLIPLVAGLAELQPWVEQWHSDVDERYGVSLAAFCREQLDQRAAQVGKTPAELAAWRPSPSGRVRKPRAKEGAE